MKKLADYDDFGYNFRSTFFTKIARDIKNRRDFERDLAAVSFKNYRHIEALQNIIEKAIYIDDGKEYRLVFKDNALWAEEIKEITIKEIKVNSY